LSVVFHFYSLIFNCLLKKKIVLIRLKLIIMINGNDAVFIGYGKILFKTGRSIKWFFDLFLFLKIGII